MTRAKLLILCLAMSVTTWATAAEQQHSAQGVVIGLDSKALTALISCQAIPGYMDAMEMPFKVRHAAALNGLSAGAIVRFDMVEDGSQVFAEHIQEIKVNGEAEPTEAARLEFLHRTLDPQAAAKVIRVGQTVPDFALIDQQHRFIHLSQFKGKVVALTFAYSRCPNPNYCFRLSNNLAQLRERFPRLNADDLKLITIVIDPANDQGAALESYAHTWKADPAQWYFLTGPIDKIRDVAALFGMNFWNDEGFLTHLFHTAVIDRDGRLVANLEGNQFTVKQLGDLVEHASQYHASSDTTAR